MNCLHASLTLLYLRVKPRIGQHWKFRSGPRITPGLSPSEQSNRDLHWRGQEMGWQGDKGTGSQSQTSCLTPELPEVVYLHDAQTDGPLVTYIPGHAKIQQSL